MGIAPRAKKVPVEVIDLQSGTAFSQSHLPIVQILTSDTTMTIPIYTVRPAIQCLRRAPRVHRFGLTQPCSNRNITTTSLKQDAAIAETTAANPPPPPPPPPNTSPKRSWLDPNTVHKHQERRLIRTKGIHPVGSRRRRAALRSSDNIPFEQLPYQCFQEARKVLQEDRESKLNQIAMMRGRIAHWQNVPAQDCEGESAKKGKLVRMHKYLEELKILADINDPVIKKRFEDGQGDMNRPIYRHLADKKWREYKRLLLMQRISQMYIVPDMLPHVDPTADVCLGFGRRNVQPGEFVDSRVSEIPPKLNVQVFDKGERLVSIVAVDYDVPNEAADTFSSRLHFLAANIPISPTSTHIQVSRLSKEEHLVQPWLPPTTQKGSPYHRIAVFIVQQHADDNGNARLDIETLRMGKGVKSKDSLQRDGFKISQFLHAPRRTVVGVHLFRSQWDEGTDDVASRAGIEGANIEFVRKKPEKLPYKKKDGARYR